MIWVKNMEKVFLYGVMDPNIMVNSIIIILMVKELILGLMADNIKENGKTIKWMAKVNSLGQMVENMLVSMLMIKSKVMGFSLGLIADNIKDIGKMENNTEEENILIPKESKEKVNGLKVKD